MQKRQKLQKIIGDISQKLTKYEYLEALEKAYFSVYEKPTFRKNYYLENLRIAGYMKSIDVINTVFPHGVNGDESLIYENSNYTENIKSNYNINI